MRGGSCRCYRAISMLQSNRAAIRVIASEADLAEGLAHLVAREPRFGAIVQRLGTPSAEQRAVRLRAIPGIGSWTADIYLLSCLGRIDIWPAADLALQAAAAHAFHLPVRPAPKVMEVLAEPWRPWRAVAARLLWAHYRAIKGIPQVVV